MEHFYHKIQGWFDYQNLYLEVIKEFSNGHFVEVGAWRGCSTAFLGVEILNSGKDIKLDVVDTWEGSANENLHNDIINHLSQNNLTLYQDFLNNIEPIKSIVNPIKMTSIEASKLYQDKSLDFVFIDANHEYENVLLDLIYWYPKVKQGGIFAGHDYPGWDGVKRAVDKYFINKHKIFNTENCWLIFKDKK